MYDEHIGGVCVASKSINALGQNTVCVAVHHLKPTLTTHTDNNVAYSFVFFKAHKKPLDMVFPYLMANL